MNDKDRGENLSLLATEIVSNALHIPKSLFCPFCAAEYMFEFTLKDHLVRKHANEIKQRNNLMVNVVSNCEYKAHQHLCPYCGAVFYVIGLLPKHIINSHGNEMFQQWQQQAENMKQVNDEKENDPSILYAACSPGLSDIYINLDSKETIFEVESLNAPKSILKKTPSSSNRIISSPSGITIRRNKNEIVKRTLSVRRELTFDLPPLEKSPLSVELSDVNKRMRCFNLKTIFFNKSKKSPKKTIKLGRKNSLLSANVVTSTPINFLDDTPLSPCAKNSKCVIRKSSFKTRPLLFASERFQCAYCKQQFYSNSDLLIHLKEHKGVKYTLRPRYQCGQCQHLFYQNSHLVRHCHFKHTPEKNRLPYS